MGTTESPEQQEGKFERNEQEKHRRQYDYDRLAGMYATFEDAWAILEL